MKFCQIDKLSTCKCIFDVAEKFHRWGWRGKEKESWQSRDSNPGPLAYRTSTLPTEVTELYSHLPTFDIRFVPEQRRNNETCTSYAHGPTRETTLSHQMSQERKNLWPDRDSNPRPVADRASTAN